MKVFLFVLAVLWAMSCATTKTYPFKELREYDSRTQQIVLTLAVNLWESGIYTEEQLNSIGSIECPIYVDENSSNIICENAETNNKEGITKSIIRCPGYMAFDKDNKPFIKIAGKFPERELVLVHEFIHYFQWRLDNKLDDDHVDTRLFYHHCSTTACKIEAVETIVDDLIKNN